MNNMNSDKKAVRKNYLDNIRWITVVIVVLYHVLYMYNAEGVLGGVGQITKLSTQPYDIFQYLVYPWFMPVLFIVAGISSRLYLEKHTNKEFIKSRTTKLLVPSTIGLFVFQFIQGYVKYASGRWSKRACSHRSSKVCYLSDYGCVRKWSTLVCSSTLDI